MARTTPAVDFRAAHSVVPAAVGAKDVAHAVRSLSTIPVSAAAGDSFV